MARTIMQVNADYAFGTSEYEDYERTIERAEALANLKGLVWKVWLRDEETQRGGGILLFEDRESAEAWFDQVVNGGGQAWTSNVTHELFGIDEELSAITNAKLGPANGTATAAEVKGTAPAVS